MFRVCVSAAVTLLSLLAASPVSAETRGVAIVLKRDKEKETLVTIYSDVKEEKKADIPLNDALKIVGKMQGWGSGVMVCIVADQNIRLGLADGIPQVPELRKLLQAVDENGQLSLVYLRIGDAKGGDDLVRHFIKSIEEK